MLSLTGDHRLQIRSKMTKSRKREFVISTSSDLRVDANGRSMFSFRDLLQYLAWKYDYNSQQLRRIKAIISKERKGETKRSEV